MLTLAEIARDWGCTPQYVSLCVKQGCPKDSFELAREWREAHTTKQSKKSPKIIDEKETQDTEPRHSGLGGQDHQSGKNGKDLDKVLENTAIAAENAWLLLDEAFLEGKASKISTFLNLHSKAVEARVKAEGMIRQELERQKVLIPMNDAKTSVRRVVEIIVSRLSAMPQNIAPRCNPHSPEHAMEILQEECTAIIADAQKASIA
jgi:hypothetical protein